MTDFLFNDITKELQDLKHKDLFRSLRVIENSSGPLININGKEFINFSSNNYLGLLSHPDIIKAGCNAAQTFGAGAGASRLVCGNLDLYDKLEKSLADFKGYESAAVFATGYMTNLGVITSLVDKHDVIILDKLNHASIIDGARLSNAKIRVYPHKDIHKLETILKQTSKYNRRLIITDAVFSMDGDIAPVAEILKLAEKYQAIVLLDDAHGGFVLGKKGKGTCEHLNIPNHPNLIQMGTLSKALGCMGGYVVGSKEFISYIQNKARSLIYSTALPPSVLASAIQGIEIIKTQPRLRSKLRENIKYFKTQTQKLGLNTLDSQTQIIPIVIGDVQKTIKRAETLYEAGIFAPAIRPPTVPKNTARIRISLTSAHTKQHIDKLVKELQP